jgi:hypothetical protein
MALPARTVRHCPLCGVAMLASKSTPDSADFDTFDCLSCNTKISAGPVRTTPDAEERDHD